MKTDVDPPIVTARAGELADQDLTQYWVVFSYRDARDLMCGVLSPSVRQQLILHLHPAKLESREEYLLRLGDYAAERKPGRCTSTPPTTRSSSTARTTPKATNPGNGRGSRKPPPVNTNRRNRRSAT